MIVQVDTNETVSRVDAAILLGVLASSGWFVGDADLDDDAVEVVEPLAARPDAA